MRERSSKSSTDTPSVGAPRAVSEVQGSRAAEPGITRAKDPAAVELGRRGGLKGGRARALKLSPAQRSEIARYAAQKRWSGG